MSTVSGKGPVLRPKASLESSVISHSRGGCRCLRPQTSPDGSSRSRLQIRLGLSSSTARTSRPKRRSSSSSGSISGRTCRRRNEPSRARSRNDDDAQRFPATKLPPTTHEERFASQRMGELVCLCRFPLGDQQSRAPPVARLLLHNDLNVAPEQDQESDETIEREAG